MVISEAMSYEIPVIATNIAGIPEMITHGVEGYLVTPGDNQAAISSMELLYQDKDLRRQMVIIFLYYSIVLLNLLLVLIVG
jgi:glycosyltransferase involved in cell wall biosynthesis